MSPLKMLFGLQNDLLYNEIIKEKIFKDAMGMCISKTPRKALGLLFLGCWKVDTNPH